MSSPDDSNPLLQNVDALVTLLDDESPRVRAACEDALRKIGPRALHALRREAREAPTLGRRSAARAWAGKLAFESGLERLAAARARGERILEIGAAILATLPDPLFEPLHFGDRFDVHAAMLRARIGPGTPLPRCIEILARYVHGDLGIAGNHASYYDSRNSFLNEVLERRLGIPISIAAIYLLLARRLDLPLEGFGVPAHFLLGYRWEGRRVFVDAFHGGQRLDPEQVREAARSQGFSLEPQSMEPATDVDLLVRMTNNLRRILEREDPSGWLPFVERLRSTLLAPPL